MSRNVQFILLAATLAGTFCLHPAALDAAPGQITDIGFLPGCNRSTASGINDLGQVTGFCGTDTTGHILLWSPGHWRQDLGTLGGGTGGEGKAINNAGQVAGNSYNPAGQYHAFRWSQATGMQDLGSLGGNNSSQAASINASGQVVGYSSTASGYPHAMRWVQGIGMQDLGTLGGGNSFANGINDAGQITGQANTASWKTHAFRWTAGLGMQDLGTLPGGDSSIGTAINAAGQVAGYATNASGQTHAMRWTEGIGMEDLGTLGGTNSSVNAIHSTGVVVGRSFLSGNTADRAALWEIDGTIVNLDSWLDSVNPSVGQYWRLDSATDINEAGLVSGIGRYDDGLGGLIDGQRGFILDVSSMVPEPGIVGILSIAAMSVLSLRRRQIR